MSSSLKGATRGLVNPSSERDYFVEARSWETDRIAAFAKSERNAWIVAIASGLIAVLSVGAVAGLTPLKRVEPFVVRVDNSTGIVDVVNSLRTSSSDYSEAVTKYFVGKYVRKREGYAYSLVDADFTEVGLLSDPAQRAQYSAYILPRNPDSPVNKLAQRGEIEVKIASISFVQKNVASVRYLRIDHLDGAVQKQSHWIATVGFSYRKAPDTEQVRELNPLGFTVVDYRVDPEVIENGPAPAIDSTLPVHTEDKP